MLYAITATYQRPSADGWTASGQVPTFYLDSRVQGIVNADHAARVALDILEAGGDGETLFHVAASALDPVEI